MDHAEFRKYKEDFLAIDLDRLEEECQFQPTLYDRAQHAVSDCKRSLNIANDDLNDIKSERWLKIINNPTEYGLPEKKNPTQADIDAVLNKDEEYRRAKSLVQGLEERLEEAKNFLKSVEEKKRDLEILARLWLGNYFAKPEVRNVEGGKKFTDFIYHDYEMKHRMKLLESHNKRQEKKQVVSEPEKEQESETPKRTPTRVKRTVVRRG